MPNVRRLSFASRHCKYYAMRTLFRPILLSFLLSWYEINADTTGSTNERVIAITASTVMMHNVAIMDHNLYYHARRIGYSLWCPAKLLRHEFFSEYPRIRKMRFVWPNSSQTAKRSFQKIYSHGSQNTRNAHRMRE